MSVYFPVDMKVEDNLLPLLSRLRYMGHGGKGQGELWGPTDGSFLLPSCPKVQAFRIGKTRTRFGILATGGWGVLL